jgi:DNA-directed RNA polymerase subunit RPC12/RpoP
MTTLPCVDCTQPVEFPEPYGDATCQACGLAMFVNEEGKTGRYGAPADPGTYGRRT